MDGWELFLLYLFIGLAVIAAICLFTSWGYHKKLIGKTITRGANGVGGQTVSLACPVGQVISFTNNNPTLARVAYICSSPDSNNFELSSCDPFYSEEGQLSSYYNPNTTQDISSAISSQCSGKNSCSWSIPSQINNICNGNGCPGTIQMIGTYDCIPG